LCLGKIPMAGAAHFPEPMTVNDKIS